MSRQAVHRHTISGGPPLVVPRRGTLALRRSKLVRRRLRMLFYTLGCCLSAAAIGHAAYGFLVETPYFKVKSIRVEGISEPITLEVLGLVEEQLAGERNILGIKTKELEQRIGRHPRVRDLHVKREFPDMLVLQAQEREPAALLVSGSEFYLLDWDGQVVAKMEPADLPNLDLPFVAGVRGDSIQVGEKLYDGSLERALYLIRVLKERNPDLYERVDNIHLTGGDSTTELESISMNLMKGLNIRFGDGDPVKKLPALETLINKLKHDGVDAYNDLEYIDLRFGGRAYWMDRKTMEDQATGKWEAVQEALEDAPAPKRSEPTGAESAPPTRSRPAASKSKPGAGTRPQPNQPTGDALYNMPQQPRF